MIRQIGQSISSDLLDVNVLTRRASGSNAKDSVNPSKSSEDLEEKAIETVDTATLQAVQISARNILKAKVKRIVKGAVNAEVTLVIAPDIELVSIVTRTSADKLGLKKGKEVFAVIKSNSVMIAAQ
ncbi:MAG: molybdopterin-binding protein [Chroococcidiopsidaceae cyanobacterium CP_BM_ER_R8_30]|nr:molybdopterin-binding protein [Chroococcidiopsidaceae cyanobacterium CP_BM_ER_R8_30]